jgi:hypothetical protein
MATYTLATRYNEVYSALFSSPLFAPHSPCSYPFLLLHTFNFQLPERDVPPLFATGTRSS